VEPLANGTSVNAPIDARVIQIKPVKGRYAQNLERLRSIFAGLVSDGSSPDLVLLPEAALTGYFLEGAVYDLALSAERFAADLVRTWRDACGSRAVDLCCGFFENDNGTYYNSALYVQAGGSSHSVTHVHRKMFLPTYGVFDEARFLSRGRRLQVFQTRFGTMALLICEDIWHALMPSIAAIKGARMLLVPSAAPGRGIEGKQRLSSVTRWSEILRSTAAEHGVFVLYAGLTGFEGGKGMTGSSCMIGPRGDVLVRAPELDACVLRATLDMREGDVARAALPLLGDLNALLPDLLLDEELPLPKGRT
jgi:predicted amidohydrolase